MIDWLSTTDVFMRRSQCCINGELAGWLGTVMIVGSVMAAIGYGTIIIVLAIARFTWFKESWNWSLYIALFQIVFFLCAATHLCTAIAFVWPAYRTFVLIEILNGSLGMTAAISLLIVVRFHASAHTNLLRKG